MELNKEQAEGIAGFIGTIHARNMASPDIIKEAVISFCEDLAKFVDKHCPILDTMDMALAVGAAHQAEMQAMRDRMKAQEDAQEAWNKMQDAEHAKRIRRSVRASLPKKRKGAKKATKATKRSKRK